MKKNLFLLVLLLPGFLSCNGTTTTSGSSNIRTSQTTSNAVYANINLGVEYMRQGSYEKALERFERARLIDPGYYPTYNMLGMLYQQLGEMDEAERYFRRALSMNDNDPNTLNNYGQFLYTTGQCNRAMDMFKRAASNPLYETPEVAYYNSGRCALQAGNNAEAERYFRQSLEKKPVMPEALVAMSELSLESQNYLSARGYLQRYLAVAKHTARTLWLGIRIERELGDKNTVSSYALLLRNSFPDSREAKLLEQSGIR